MNDNIEVFTSASSSSDKSIGFFNEILGFNWQSILDGQSPVGGASGVIFTVLNAFGSVMLAAICVLMMWVAGNGVIGTAHEGESLGKRYSTLWTPLRIALSISLLMPLPWYKVAVITALALKMLGYSISGANYVSVIAVDYMVQHGGAVTTKRAPLPLAEGLASEILKNLVVQEYYQEREGQSYGQGTEDTSTDGVKSFVFTPPGESIVLYPYMGRIKTTCMSVDASICQQENQLGMQFASDLRPIAKALVSQWSGGANTSMDATQEQLYRSAINNYAIGSQQLATSALNALGSNAKLATLTQAVKNNGWTWLGAYYGKMSAFNEHAQKKGQTKITISSALSENGVTMLAGKEIEPIWERYHTFIAKIDAGRIAQQRLAATANDSAGAGALLGSLFTDAIGSSVMVVGGENTALTGSGEVFANTIAKGDPIENLQSLGHQLVNAGTILITAGAAGDMAVDVLKDAAKAASVASPLTSKVSSAGADVVATKLGKLTGLLIPLGFALTMTGALLAYYLPALPFILWTSAIVGWLILSMELIVSVYVWAAMHAIPEGEGMAGQHGRQGYMLFFGILVRPALHVVGFFMAFIIVGVIGHFVGESYLDFVTASEQGDEPFGPVSQMVGWLATLLVGGSLIVIATHKSFSLITWLPDNILRWAGGNQPSLGEHNDEARASQLYAAAVNRTHGAVTSGMAGAASASAKNAMKTGKGAGGVKPMSPEHHMQGNKE